MPNRGSYTVWIWKDDQGTPKYVGWGKITINHPAKYAWAIREKYDSDLNKWLRENEQEPRRDVVDDIRYSKEDACYVANKLRRMYDQEGVELLESRPHGTRKGGGRAKPVLGPDLQIYDSVRSAAKSEGVHPCTITRYCQTEGSGWDYLN